MQRDEDKMVSKTTKEKVVYWATKLECPVDDNANYENTYVRIVRVLVAAELKTDMTVAVVQQGLDPDSRGPENLELAGFWGILDHHW